MPAAPRSAPLPAPRRDRPLKVMVTSEEAALIRERAAEARRSMSDYARLKLLDELHERVAV